LALVCAAKDYYYPLEAPSSTVIFPPPALPPSVLVPGAECGCSVFRRQCCPSGQFTAERVMLPPSTQSSAESGTISLPSSRVPGDTKWQYQTGSTTDDYKSVTKQIQEQIRDKETKVKKIAIWLEKSKESIALMQIQMERTKVQKKELQEDIRDLDQTRVKVVKHAREKQLEEDLAQAQSSMAGLNQLAQTTAQQRVLIKRRKDSMTSRITKMNQLISKLTMIPMASSSEQQ